MGRVDAALSRLWRKPKSQGIEWSFPGGASLSFAHLEHDKTVLGYQGAQIAYLGFDELAHFTEKQFWYMLSRNRPTSGIRPYVRATTNPDADSWVARLIGWWIDRATGLAIPERAGALRWFARIGGRLARGDSAAELRAAHSAARPKSLTFIPANLADNRILENADPDCRANLDALPRVERERLLRGNWKVRATAGALFRREWFPVVDAVPAGGRVVRAYDLAATEKKTLGDDPDWTASVRVRRVPDATDARGCSMSRARGGCAARRRRSRR